MESDNRNIFLDKENLSENVIGYIEDLTEKKFKKNDIENISRLAQIIADKDPCRNIKEFNEKLIAAYMKRFARDTFSGITEQSTVKQIERRAKPKATLEQLIQKNIDSNEEVRNTMNQLVSIMGQMQNVLVTQKSSGTGPSLIAGPQSKLQRKTYQVHFNSLVRDVNAFPNPSDYRLGFFQGQIGQTRGFIKNLPRISNVTTIQLISGRIPNFYKKKSIGNTTDQFMYLRIEDIEGDLHTTQSDFRMFGLLEFDLIQAQTANFLTLTTDNYKPIKSFPDTSAFSNLNNMRIILYDQNGVLFNFGSDSITISSYTAVSDTVITTASSHGVDVGDKIYITNYTGGNNSTINRDSGHIVSEVVSDTQFKIGVDLSAGAGTGGKLLIGALQNDFVFQINTLE